MRSPFNSPVEVGVRVVMLLGEAYPDRLGINELVLLDHGVLHSADLGGPPSLHPPLPTRVGELGFKRTSIQGGLQLALQARLVNSQITLEGLTFAATEAADSFTRSLAAPHARQLRARTTWVLQYFGDLGEASMRRHMNSVFGSWSEEFTHPQAAAFQRGES